MKRIPILSALACILCQAVSSQTLFSDGSVFHITNGGVVFVNGGAEFAANSVVNNDGQMTVTKNSTFPAPGNFTLNANSTANGNGGYRVEQDWVNNAFFNAGNSTVELYGNTAQNITSANGTVTVFHNLTLTGTGAGNDRKKILQGVDARTDASGVLDINDRELATETNTFFVTNPDVAALVSDVTPGAEGFVSSLSPGYFSRLTANNVPFLFPTGSSVGTLRYRPVIIGPVNGNPNEYRARLNNNDASADNFDRTRTTPEVCKTNDLYYHSIERTSGNTDANVTLNYVAAADGNWQHIARWRAIGGGQWNLIDPVVTGPALGFTTVTKTNWNFPDPDHPYILSEIRPLPPQIACPDICENSGGNVFAATGSPTSYLWTVPAQGTLVGGQGTHSITVDWTTGTDYVYVQIVGNPGCNSLPDSCRPYVKPRPVAAFASAAENVYTPVQQFTDQSAGAEQWLWEFGDGQTSGDASPTHQFPGEGTYHITLTVTSKEGCTDDTDGQITIEGNSTFIPNAFTPNFDNLNEGFRPVNRSGEGVEFFIFNRWGELIYSATDTNAAWDGTYAGKPCPNGLYVYRVQYKDSEGATKTVIGHVTLVQ